MQLLAAFSFDLSDPMTWSVLIAAVAAVLVLLTFPAAKLGAQKVQIPIWVPIAIAVIAFLGAGAGAWVYITKPIELERSPYEYSEEAMVVQAEGMSEAELPGGGGMGMMGMGMPAPGGAPGGYPGMDQRPPGGEGAGGGRFARFRLIGTLRTLQQLVASGELKLTDDQKAKLVELLQPIAQKEELTDDDIRKATETITAALTEEQRNGLRQAVRQRRAAARKGAPRKGRRPRVSIQELATQLINALQGQVPADSAEQEAAKKQERASESTTKSAPSSKQQQSAPEKPEQ